MKWFVVQPGDDKIPPGMNPSSARDMKDKLPSTVFPKEPRVEFKDSLCVRNGETRHHHSVSIETPGSNSVSQTNTLGRTYSPKTKKAQRKLVLHLDLRNTVLVADSVTNVSVEQALNSFISGVTWGCVDERTGNWKWYSDTPSLSPPAQGTNTIYKHLEKQLVKTPEDRPKLRLVTGDFTQRDIGAKFQSYFQKQLRLLRWPHITDEETETRLTMKGRDDSLYHYILPSFFKLLFQLKKAGRDFAVIFRTYGLDSSNVLLSTEHTIKGHHPLFPEALDMKVNREPGRITRGQREAITLEVKSSNLDGVTSKLYQSERKIYETLSNTDGVVAYKDDFPYWQTHGYHYTAGKPLWVDLNDPSVHHIIFDDNMRTYEEDNIVEMRLLEGNECTSVDKSEISKYEDIFMVQANLMESIGDEDYFIKKVQQCEQNYVQLLGKMNGCS